MEKIDMQLYCKIEVNSNNYVDLEVIFLQQYKESTYSLQFVQSQICFSSTQMRG